MIRIVFALLLAPMIFGVTHAQTKSMTGTVVDTPDGMYKWTAIVIKVGGKRYFVYTSSTVLPTPKTVGTIDQVGRTVQVFYTRILPPADGYDGELRATRIVEVKKSNTSPTEGSLDTCKFCGTWEYFDNESQTRNFFKIVRAGVDRFKFIPGFVGVGGQIAWQENEQSGLIIRNANGIYLKSLNGKLVGNFMSPNFRATHGHEFKYTITCTLRKDGKVLYTVSGIGPTERHLASRIGD